jgi:hypothetical protein
MDHAKNVMLALSKSPQERLAHFLLAELFVASLSVVCAAYM